MHEYRAWIIIHVHCSCSELWMGSGPAQNKKEEKKDLLGRDQPKSWLGLVQSNSFGLGPAQLTRPAQPIYLIIYYNIIY
jgi:hypothetical protein